MERRVVFVAEYNKNDNNWIENEVEKMGVNYSFIYNDEYNADDYAKRIGRIIYWRKYIKLAKRTINETTEDDMIVGLTFTLGLAISILAKLSGQKRNVLSLNLISYDNSKLDFIKVPLFRWAFLKNNLISTVNAHEYSRKFNEKFKLNGKKVFYILNDPYNERFIDKNNLNDKEENYCFSGGEANRDWDVLLESARICNNVKFEIIARKRLWNPKKEISKNVEVAFDKKSNEFIEKLKNSKIVIVTLKDDMVAGLTVFIQAIAMKKFVLVTDIPATRIYVPNDCKDILIKINDYKMLSNKIEYYSKNINEKNVIIDKLYKNLINNFSKEMYVTQIIEILNNEFNK